MELKLTMDHKTFLSKTFPDFVNQWNKYAQQLKTLETNIDKWVITSDYCLDDKNRANDIMTFSIFPLCLAPLLKQGIKEHLNEDLKHTTKLSDFAIKFIKEFPYIFSICVIIKDKNNIVQIDQNKEILDKLILSMKKWPENKQKEFSKIKTLRDYFNRKNADKKTLSEICIVCHIMSIIIEFLMIKSHAKQIIWISDRDAITNFQDGIISELVRIGYANLIHNRVPDHEVFAAVKGKDYEKDLYDELIRIPDYISGTVADIDFQDKDKATDKHYTLFDQSIVGNERIFLMEIDKDGISSVSVSRNDNIIAQHKL